MVLDSSAVVAILLKEPSAGILMVKLRADEHILIGAPTLVECYIVATSRLGPPAARMLDRFLSTHAVQVVDFGREHYQEAAEAFRVYGKGRHPAALNLGDCFSYATALLTAQPLLYVGNDFALTPIPAA